MNYPWYETINDSNEIQQGDLITKCPIIKPPRDILQGVTKDVDVELINSIVLSQSCDLINNKLEIVLVCPYYTLNKFVEDVRKPDQKINNIKDNLRKGNYASFHLLNRYPDFLEDCIVVDFKNVYGIHFEELKNIAIGLKTRLRLLPPYREHLSQAFARYFMRVGLPQDISI